VWAYPGTVEFFEYPLLSQEWVELRTSNFVRTFLVSMGTKALYSFGKRSRGRSQNSRNLSGYPYIGRIAQSSLQKLGFLVFNCTCNVYLAVSCIDVGLLLFVHHQTLNILNWRHFV